MITALLSRTKKHRKNGLYDLHCKSVYLCEEQLKILVLICCNRIKYSKLIFSNI